MLLYGAWVFSLPAIAGLDACIASYFPADGTAILPCVETQEGQWYNVRLKRKQGLEFTVEQAEKYDEFQLEDPSNFQIRTEYLPARTDGFDSWLFIEIPATQQSTMFCVMKGKALEMDRPNDEGGHGRIEINLVIQKCDNTPPSHIVPGAPFFDVVRISQSGLYDIYVNDKMLKTVEIPDTGAGNQ